MFLDLLLEALPIVELATDRYREHLGDRSYFTQQAEERLKIMESVIESSELLSMRRQARAAEQSRGPTATSIMNSFKTHRGVKDSRKIGARSSR